MISTLAGVGSLIPPVLVSWLNDLMQTPAAGQYYFAALLIVGAVTVLAIGPHDRKRCPSFEANVNFG